MSAGYFQVFVFGSKITWRVFRLRRCFLVDNKNEIYPCFSEQILFIQLLNVLTKAFFEGYKHTQFTPSPFERRPHARDESHLAIEVKR
jgi:hypothetical protein